MEKNVNTNQTVSPAVDVNGKIEKDISKKSKKKEKTSNQVVSIFRLFRYAKLTELFYLLVGIIAAIVSSVILPVMLVVYGDTINIFINRASNLCSLNLKLFSEQFCPSHITLTSINFYTNIQFCNLTDSNFTNIYYDIKNISRKPMFSALIIGFVSVLSVYIRVISLNILAERQSRTIRQIFFQSLLKKDVVFFDKHQTGQLNLYLTENINKIQNGMGDKLGSAIEMIATAISCFVIGFSRGWKLAFVILSLSPVIIISLTILFKISAKLTAKELKTYGKAGAIAEEVISSIQTVLSYNGQEKEIEKYEQHLDDAKLCGMKKTFILCFSKGVTFCLLFCIYALGFWYGAKLVREEGYNIGNVFTIFMEINFGVFCLGQANTFFQAISEAQTAAFSVWQTIDEPSTIFSNTEIANDKDEMIGDIHFSNVHFSYPSRMDLPVLNNLSFDIKSGQTVALVGTSGSGKSTCIQLLQRFYDPQSGLVQIDGKSVSEYNLRWLRQHIGVVSQEPVLFHTTIRQNILFGHESATDDEIQRAAKMANAHNFIMTLPNKYETEVGERGSALSGGQKQRIAIARALLRDPKILLLDEATSALDNESEKIVQEALNRAAQGRTTLIIAHRLSTIRHADKIIVMQKGEVIEEGDHDTLMKNESIYFNLVQQQTTQGAEEKEEEEFEKEETTKRLLSELTDDSSHRVYSRQSTLISITPSIFGALYAKQHSMIINNNEIPKEKIEASKNENVALALLKVNKPEWYLIIIGCIAAALNGVQEIVYAVVQTNLATVFQDCNFDTQKRKVSLYILIYLGLGLFSLISNAIQGYVFARSGESLTKRLRSLIFRSILRQEINFFDQPNHNTGVLCTRLAVDTSVVQGATGIGFGLITEHLFSITIGVIIGLIYSWRITLSILPFVPLILIGGVLQIRWTMKFVRRQKDALDSAGKITAETLQNIRTVYSLSKEEYFNKQYSEILDTIYCSSLKHIHILAFICAISSSVFYFTITVFIAVSGSFIEQRLDNFQSAFMIVNTVVFTARNISRALTILPDYGKAIEAAENIFHLINRKATINNESNNGEQISNFQGEIKFDNVYFTYPNRPESIILRNLQLNIKPGQTVAFVGTSGCGKSTSIQLIERFYDPNIGAVLADSKDIRSLNLQWYRSQIGIVSQEPVLFNMSIRDNIAYGDNNRTDISLDEIVEVAKQANIHDFILTLPQGYETSCGAKGSQLSGGQKQRIAIARALIRNPKILLLDEATSALDNESEKIVQEALDRAQENRTSIIIAHRLSTIRNADVIYVLHHGTIVESGSHDELMALGGRYFRLVERKLK